MTTTGKLDSLEAFKEFEENREYLLSHTPAESIYNIPESNLRAILEKLYIKPEKVDRFEVIDDTGRAYVKGSIYGSPVKVELDYQDEGRTLKVFVRQQLNLGGSE